MQMTVNHKSFELRRYTNMAAVVFPGKFWTLCHQVKTFYALNKQTPTQSDVTGQLERFFFFFRNQNPKAMTSRHSCVASTKNFMSRADDNTQRTLCFCEKFCLKWAEQSYGTKLKAQYFQIRLSKYIDNSIFINLPFFSVFSLESVYHFFL